jgi:hypothetical protein
MTGCATSGPCVHVFFRETEHVEKAHAASPLGSEAVDYATCDWRHLALASSQYGSSAAT